MTLLDEFIEAWKAGRRLDVDAYLARAPKAERDELAEQIGMWLEIAPTPDYDAATRAQIAQEPALVAALRPPLPERLRRLRESAGLDVRELAQRVVAAFGLSDADRAADYLGRLEAHDLDEKRLSNRLLGALETILGADLLPRLAPPAPAASPARKAFFRANAPTEEVMSEIDTLSRAAFTGAPQPLDELDRLFVGGPNA